MKRDPLKATVLATRYIPNATQKMVQDLITAGGIIEYDPQRHRSLALLTADCDDVTYTALDEATKKADVDVIYARSFYAGAANANTKLAGESWCAGRTEPGRGKSRPGSCCRLY